MAKYFLHVDVLSRAKGCSPPRAAAYRAGERIREERSGAVHDYTDRTDVIHSEILLPSEYTDDANLDWARNRSVLWNKVQGAGQRRNARLAREVRVTLPAEFTAAERVALVRSFSQELADRYHSAVDFAVHAPRAYADQRHHHAHMLMTCRQPGPEGIGARTTLELSGTERHERGLGPSRNELLWKRERWAQLANEHLLKAGLTADMDHRSYAAQGLDLEPKVFIPRKIFYAERRLGAATPAGNNVRARYLERVEARKRGPKELARVLQQQRETARRRAIQASQQQSGERKIPTGAMNREQLNAKRREHYRANAAEIRRKNKEYQRKRTLEGKAAEVKLSAEAKTPSGVEKWLAYRESQKGIIRQDPIERWKALRKEQQENTNVAARDRTHDQNSGSRATQKRGPKNDFGL